MVKYGAFDREIKKYPENPSVGTDQPAQTCRPPTDPHGWTDHTSQEQRREVACRTRSEGAAALPVAVKHSQAAIAFSTQAGTVLAGAASASYLPLFPK